MKILPPNNLSLTPDKDTKKGLDGKGGLSFSTKLVEFVLNDKTQACAFIFGLLLFLFYAVFTGLVLYTRTNITPEITAILDRIWQAFLLCLGVMIGGKIHGSKPED